VMAGDHAGGRARRCGSPLWRSAIAVAILAFVLGAAQSAARAQDQGTQDGGAAGADRGAPPSPSGLIQFPNIPHIALQVLPGYGPSPLRVGFLVMHSNPESAPFVSYRWNFGDGNVSTLPPTVLFHIYTNPGTYTVTVTATTADGQSATGFAGVTVTQAAN